MTFTADQTKALSAKLDGATVKRNPRGYSYLEGWHVIAEANRIFGFDGWDRQTMELRQVVEAPRKIGRDLKEGWTVSYTAKVRILVTAGGSSIIREGVGYGSGIDVDLGSAHESAIKEAETDAMKRGFMTFGNQFGLALYDKAQENVEHSAPARDDRSPADDFFERAKLAISNHTDPVKLKEWVEVNMPHLDALPKDQGKLLYSQFQKRMGALAQAPGKAAA